MKVLALLGGLIVAGLIAYGVYHLIRFVANSVKSQPKTRKK